MNRKLYNFKLVALNLIYFASVTGCHFFKNDSPQYDEVTVTEKVVDFNLPKEIFDKLENDLLSEGEKLQPVYLFSPLQVVVSSDLNSVVKNSPVRIAFPNGGGILDLKDFVSGQGTFSLSFPPEQFIKLPKLDSLYFLSDTSKKKIDGEDFGMGCGKFVNLSQQFESLKKIDFLKLNTTDLRYLYVVTGFYIFLFKEKNQIYLSHVHVTDSRYPDIYCSNLEKNKE